MTATWNDSNEEAAGIDEFFDKKQTPATLKHAIIAKYLPVFFQKVGSTAEGRRVVVVDGYAGTGRYKDGSPGSALVLMEAALKASTTGSGRNVDVLLVEKNRQHHAALTRALEAEGHTPGMPPINAKIEDAMPAILDFIGSAPAFFLFDPYGLGLTFDNLVQVMNRGPALKTELLLNFSANAVRRIGGRLSEQENATGRAATLAGLDAACGGSWWRDVWRDSESPKQASESIAAGYLGKLCEATKSVGWCAGVQKKPTHQPDYHLVYLTRHLDGLHTFGDGLSKAQEEWRLATAPHDLFGTPELLGHEEERLASNWVLEIKRNISELLSENEYLEVGKMYSEIMGSAVGLAREMHVRRALKELHEEGSTLTDSKGSIWRKVVRRS